MPRTPDRPGQHWLQRCRERGVGVDPVDLWHEVRRAVRERDESFVKFCGKTARQREVYLFRTPAGLFGAVVTSDTHIPITVLKEGMQMRRRKPSRRRRPLRVAT